MALPGSSLIKGLVARILPQANIDNPQIDVPPRLAKYGELYGQIALPPTSHSLCEEGSYMVATNPTVSTGLTQVAAQTTFVDTTPVFYIWNAENPADPAAKTLWLHYIKMMATAVGTAATSWHYAFVLDNVARALSTDNMLAIVPVNPGGANGKSTIIPFGGSGSSIFKIQNSATASVIAASSPNKRLVARGVLGGLNIVGTEMVIVFGSTDIGGHAGLTAAEAAAPGRRIDNAPPVGIPPGFSLTGHLWGIASTAAFGPEVEIGMWAR